MSKKVHAQLFWTGVACILAATLAASLLYYRAFSQQMKSRTAELAQIYAAAYQEAPENFAALFDTAASARLTLIAPDGSVLYDSQAPGTLENHSQRPEVIHAWETGQGSAQRVSSTLSVRTFYEALLLNDGNVLRVAMDTASIYAVFLAALPWLMLVLCVLAALSYLISQRLTQRLVRPIVALGQHLDEVERYIPYPELEPLCHELAEDRAVRENTERIRQEFTANVSHELKTPLTSISGYAELLAQGMVQAEDVPRFAGQIQRESARMIALVSDIIKLAALESGDQAGQSSLECAPVDLRELATQVARSMQMHAQKAFITLSAAGESAVIQGNWALLVELCENLTGNAIRYNRPGGWVAITSGTRSGRPFLRVEDNGIGIPKEAQSRVFERFYRVDKSRSKATGGTGLGLAIVKHIALQHKATVELKSQVGRGTCITVSF